MKITEQKTQNPVNKRIYEKPILIVLDGINDGTHGKVYPATMERGSPTIFTGPS
mgnify:CR=1 FL=1|jgi:hypothetical protein